MSLDHGMQHQDAKIRLSHRALWVVYRHTVEWVAAGCRSGVAAQPGNRQVQPVRDNAHREDAMRLREVVEPAELGIDALRRVAAVFRALARRIMIATDGEDAHTGVPEPGELC